MAHNFIEQLDHEAQLVADGATPCGDTTYGPSLPPCGRTTGHPTDQTIRWNREAHAAKVGDPASWTTW